MSLFAISLSFALLQTPGLEVTKVKELPGLRPLALSASPTGRKVAMTLEDLNMRVFDPESRQTLWSVGPFAQSAYAVDWSADGNYIVTGDESARVIIWDARTHKKVREMREHIRGIHKVSMNLSHSYVMSTGKDDVIKIYDFATGKVVNTILGKGANFYGATFHPLNNTFGTGILGTGARLYDVKSGQVTGFLTGHNGQGVFDVDWNPAGTRVVTAGRDGNASLWDPKSFKRIGDFKGSTDWVVDVEFSPNGKFLAASSTDGHVRVYNVANLGQVADLTAQSYVGSPLAWTGDGKSLLSVTDQGFLQINSVSPAQPAAVGKTLSLKKPVKKKGAKKKK